MRFYEIALFILIFNISIAIVNSTGAFPSELDRAVDDDYIVDARQRGETFNASSTEVSQGNDFLTAVGNYVGGFFLFIATLFHATVAVEANIASMLGGSSEAHQFAAYISYIVYFIYIVAIVQFRANRSFKAME